jgi:hypothetical protein
VFFTTSSLSGAPGDGSIIEFRGVVDALRGAVHVQAAMIERSSLRALDDASMVHGDGRIGQVVSKYRDPHQRAVFVHPCKPAIAGDA